MFNNDMFYPTPKNLADKMISLIQGDPQKVLEPSAGKGDIIEALQESCRYDRDRRSYDISAIEIDENLQALLRGKRIKVIDTDFLSFEGPDKFDIIIANPPFCDGDKHLLKAIDIMYRGEIIFLLNAETIRNPHTNTRKELVKKLDELNAEIEYIEGAFKDAERPTGVEVVLIYIKVERNIEDDLFAGADDTIHREKHKIEEKHELSTGKTIAELVTEYNEIIHIGTETILGYYKNYKKIGGYLRLNEKPDKYDSGRGDMTAKMQNELNTLLASVRETFWRKTLELEEVTARLTSKKRQEFEHQLSQHCNMDFTEKNIRQFVLNLIGGYQKTLEEAVVDIFDKFTRHSYHNENLYEENIHYFNGWKTNSAFKVNKRVVLPIYGSYGGAFTDSYSDKWGLNRGAEDQLRDIDLVMNYFDGMHYYLSMGNAIRRAFSIGKNTKIRSEYFTVNCYKKGTIHLTFNDDDILRRFNVVACKGKNWLPCDYGAKSYAELVGEEKSVVDAFEGSESYALNRSKALLTATPQLQLAA